LRAEVSGGNEVFISEQTNYPFEERIRFQVSTTAPIEFPFHLRIPGWCENPVIRINGEPMEFSVERGMVVLHRQWKDGDILELQLPMKVKLNRWVENSVSVERGPLVYALKIRERWSEVSNNDRWGDFSEVHPMDPWNYGLMEGAIQDPEAGFEFISPGFDSTDRSQGATEMDPYPWNLEHAPVFLKTRGKIIPDWTLYRDMAGPLPHSLPLKHLEKVSAEEIVLIPYGCTTLRITEFPVVR
jgi:hypothetical protein